MDTKNKISIIIPTYNRQNLIGKTLDNILNQTLKPYEIIVIDDHSTDGTVEWLKERYENKIILLSNIGKGPGAARNLGIKHSTGDYIKFFDSDDLMTVNHLEDQLKNIIETNADFVYSPFIMAEENDEKGWIQTDVVFHTKSNNFRYGIKNLMLRELFIPIPSMLFKREIVEKVGQWQERWISHEDWDYLWRLAALKPKVAYTNNSAFLYRIHGKQTTISNITTQERLSFQLDYFSSIQNEVEHSTAFTFYEKQKFSNRINQIKKELGLTNNNNLTNQLRSIYFRVENKIDRIVTQSAWPPIRHISTSKDLFNKYINLVFEIKP